MSSELKKYRELPIGGALPRELAQHPITGNWRTGEKPRVSLDSCVNCLICWIDCPDASVLVNDGTTFYGFDYDHCKGCGICAAVCPTGAIEMVAEEVEVPAYGRVGGASR